MKITGSFLLIGLQAFLLLEQGQSFTSTRFDAVSVMFKRISGVQGSINKADRWQIILTS
jgi:hypothetical protein